MRKILGCFIIIMIMITSQIFAGTIYYVDATNGSDSNSGTSPAIAWKTINKVNNSSFNPGDSILFKRGETWREQLIVPSSGSIGNPITFSAYGSAVMPIITARDSISGWDTAGNWTNEKSFLWYMPLANDPYRIFLFETEYIEAETKGDINISERWWYDSGNTNLYIYATSNPASFYSKIEGSNLSTYSSAIQLNGKDYITIQELEVRGGYMAIDLDNSDHDIIDNCTVGLYAGRFGVRIENNSDSNEVKNCTIESGLVNSTYSYISDVCDGIFIFDNSDNNKIHDNAISNWNHNCVSIENTDNAKTANHNEVYENILSSPNTNYCRGILTDAGTSDDTCAYNKIYRNYIKNTTQRNQIHGNHNEFYYNIVDTVSASSVVAYAGSCDGLAMFAAEGQKCHDNKIYNNIFYNLGAYGIKIMGEAEWGDKQSNLFKNNIIMNWGAGKYGIHIDDDATILDNTYQNNSLYKSGITDVVYYGHDGADDYPHTIAEFNAENGTASDVIGSNIGVDPLMTDPANDNFKLNPHSPCINAGTDVSLTEDYEGNAVPQGSAPDIGAYEYGELGETIIINPILKIIINPIIIKPIIK